MTYVSPQVRGMLGYSPREWEEDPDFWVTLIHPDDRGRVLAENAESAAGEGIFSSEYRLVAKDGGTVWVRDGAVLVRDELGEPLFWQGVMFDITTMKRAEETLHVALEKEREAADLLRDVDRMRNTAMHALAHDLRTSLADVKAAADVLSRELELTSEDRQWLARGIRRQAHKVDRLLMDLLDLDRLERGILEPRREPTDLVALAKRVISEQKALHGRKVKIEGRAVTARVEASKVERILENLLANVATHTPDGVSVWVRITPSEGGILIAVEDAGPRGSGGGTNVRVPSLHPRCSLGADAGDGHRALPGRPIRGAPRRESVGRGPTGGRGLLPGPAPREQPGPRYGKV
jgi:PAS domain S-box-containing protein